MTTIDIAGFGTLNRIFVMFRPGLIFLFWVGFASGFLPSKNAYSQQMPQKTGSGLTISSVSNSSGSSNLPSQPPSQKVDLGRQGEKTGFEIIQFLGEKKAGEFALIDGRTSDGLGQGVLLKSYRKMTQSGPGSSLWVETGKLKVAGKRGRHVFAEILEDSSPLSKESFPTFPGPMAGDHVVPSQVVIKKVAALLPVVEISYFDLFEDPTSLPRTFELKENGKAELLSKMNSFKTAHIPLILIEGHTSYTGSSESNQIESYQRSKTIRSFLVSNLGFDPERVLAVGYGESDLKDKSFTEGHERRNRRIIIKAVDSLVE